MTAPSSSPPVAPSSRARVEDDRFITGSARFVSDISLSGEVAGPVLYAEFVRSPEAHARVLSIDADEARGAAGVSAVFTADDLEVADFGSASPPVDCEGMDRPILARDAIRYAGEAVAMVVAATKELAVDAAMMAWVDYEPLTVVASAREAIDGDVVIHEAAGSNVAESWAFKTPGDPPAVEHEVSISVVNGRLVPNPMEPLAILAVPDGDGLTVFAGHQRPHALRDTLASHLGLDQSRVRVIVPDVGGAFGMKGMEFPEYVAVASAAHKLGSPVEWTQTRREHFLTGTHGRGHHHRVTLGGDSEGRLLSARVEILADAGAYPHNAARIPSFTRYVATGLYDIPFVDISSQTVVTNLAPVGSYRGAGRPEAAYAIERAIDAFARSLGMDPFEVRRRNVITSLPHRSQTGALYDSGDYSAALDRAEELVDAAAVRVRQKERLESGLNPIGLGVAAFIERAGGAVDTGEFARVEMTSDGILEVRTGSMSSGQGHETVWPQIAAEAFGISPGRVRLVAGDTSRIARGTGTAASRSTMIGGSAVLRTGRALAEKTKQVAADLIEANAADLVIGDEGVSVSGQPGLLLSWPDLVARAEESLSAEEWYVPGAQTFPYGAVAAVVEVDVETGAVQLQKLVAVDDFGNVINPMLVEGQVHGSLAQGIAQALLEGVEYSPDGQLMTSSFMDYAVPVATNHVEIVTDRLLHPAPSNALGAKGAGESGCIGAPPAIVNAVLDALAPWGVTHLDMPLTPSRVWGAIQVARAAEQPG
ncbi:MAG: xanthine dehydrogenase family protein molybdopterin-binding subunit [Acidimicrobiia bacterium]